MSRKGVIVVPPATVCSSTWAARIDLPALAWVANRPILAHVIDAMAAAEITEIAVLSCSETAEHVSACIRENTPDGVRIQSLNGCVDTDPVQVQQEILDFAAGASTVIHRADGMLSQPLSPLLDAIGEDGTELVVLMAKEAQNLEHLGPAGQSALRVAAFHPTASAMGMAGVCVLGAGAVERLRSEAETRLLAGREEVRSIVEALLSREDGGTQVRIVRGWHAFGGAARDLLDLNRVVLDRLDYESAVHQPGGGNTVEGPVLIHPDASVTASVISGPAIIGRHACIADSYIGPHTAIGEGARVEGSEVEGSIVLRGASILHVGGRLVGSVLGCDARVFRDFSIPRALRLQVGDGNEVALC